MFHNAEQFKQGDVVVCIHQPTEAEMLLSTSYSTRLGYNNEVMDAMRSALDYHQLMKRRGVTVDAMRSALDLGESYTVSSSTDMGVTFEGKPYAWPSSWFESVQDHQEKAKAFLQKQGYAVTKVATPLPSMTDAQKRMHAMVEYLSGYLSTYSSQTGYLDYSDEIFINDVLYGLGVALDKERFSYHSGANAFKAFLRDYLQPAEK